MELYITLIKKKGIGDYMLANGTSLSYKVGGSGSFTELTGLEKVPDWKFEREEIEVKDLTKSTITKELGAATIDAVEYEFHTTEAKLDTNCQLAQLYELDKNNTIVSFKEMRPNAETITYDAMVTVQINGGELNSLRQYVLTVAPTAKPEITFQTA